MIGKSSSTGKTITVSAEGRAGHASTMFGASFSTAVALTSSDTWSEATTKSHDVTFTNRTSVASYQLVFKMRRGASEVVYRSSIFRDTGGEKPPPIVDNSSDPFAPWYAVVDMDSCVVTENQR